MTTERLGVGIAGCGAAAQAIHLPALASLPEEFRIVRCFDPYRSVAEEVAARVGAKHSVRFDDLLEDPEVEVVLVCSPSQFHADQVRAACRAGKRAVLCEKPLAESADDADEIAALSREFNVPVLTGTMHRFDPALRQIESVWGELPSLASLIRSVTYITPNALLVALATEPALPPPRKDEADQEADPSERNEPFEVQLFRHLMLGLALHELPLIRIAMPEVESVEVTELLGFGGYEVVLRAGNRIAEISAMLYEFSRVEWTLELIAEEAHAKVSFPPGYLSSQSASATLWLGGKGHLRERTFGTFHETGYRAEWRHLHEVVSGRSEPLTGAESAAEDVRLALRIADSFKERFHSRE